MSKPIDDAIMEEDFYPYPGFLEDPTMPTAEARSEARLKLPWITDIS